MWRGLVLAAMLLPLSGCYLPPEGPPGYLQPAYAQPGYPPPGYPPPGYPPAAYDPYGNVYPGYNYNGGAPTLLVDGEVMPLILFGGGWGYWDSRHNWHRAPDPVSHHLEQQRTSGVGFRPGGGGFSGPGPNGRPPPSQGNNGAQTVFHPNAQPNPANPQRPATPPQATHGERGHDCPPAQRC